MVVAAFCICSSGGDECSCWMDNAIDAKYHVQRPSAEPLDLCVLKIKQRYPRLPQTAACTPSLASDVALVSTSGFASSKDMLRYV